jgi:hypothetical protein
MVQIVGGVVFIAWLVHMYLWIRRGCPTPLWLHVLAIIAFVLGTGLGLYLFAHVGRSIGTTLACALGFPAGTYLGWLWVFAPCLTENGQRQGTEPP